MFIGTKLLDGEKCPNCGKYGGQHSDDDFKSCLKGKTLIGTCGDCDYWRKGNAEVPDECGAKENMHLCNPSGFIMPWDEFGCIHWKEKPIENK